MEIASYLPAIVTAIEQKPIVLIEAPTGSGKSIGVPSALAKKHQDSVTFVVVPTRTAARGLADYQSKIQNALKQSGETSSTVGYAAEGEIMYRKDTSIVYATSGHARLKILGKFYQGILSDDGIDFCQILMVDEIHSGSIDNTIILGLWRYAVKLGARVPRLILASATPADIGLDLAMEKIVVPVKTKPIKTIYNKRDYDRDQNYDSLHKDTAILAAEIHNNTNISTGNILIFAAGGNEIDAIHNNIMHILKTNEAKNYLVIPVISRMSKEDINKIFIEVEGQRKIIISTNIAETSVTVNDLGYVIDTMLEKRAESSKTGGLRLVTHYISKSSAKQRQGRTGRTIAGTCYRMCTEEKFNSLEDHRPPEIERVPIESTVIQLLSVELPVEELLWMVDRKKLTSTINTLKELNMLSALDSGKNKVTEMGLFAADIPLAVKSSAILFRWLEQNLPPFPGVVAVCLIDCFNPSYFWVPRKDPSQTSLEYDELNQAHKEKYFEKYTGNNDLESCLLMWLDFHKHIIMAEPKGISNNSIRKKDALVSKWCRQNSLNNKKIRELLKIVDKITNYLKTKQKLNIVVGPYTVNGFMNKLKPILLDVYSDQIFIAKRDNVFVDKLGKEYRLDKNLMNKFSEINPNGIIAIINSEIQNKKGISRFVSFAVDTDVDSRGNPLSKSSIEKRGKRATKPQKILPKVISTLQTLHGIPPSSENSYQDSSLDDALNLLNSITDSQSSQSLKEKRPKEERLKEKRPKEERLKEERLKEVEVKDIRPAINLLQKIGFDEMMKVEKPLVVAHKILSSIKKGERAKDIKRPEELYYCDQSSVLMETLSLINTEIAYEIYNPPLVIEKIKADNNKVFNLIQENYLEAGTKQRGLKYFMDLKDQGYEELVMYSIGYGYGQVALAWCSAQAGMKATIFINKERKTTEMTKLAKTLGANVVEKGGKDDYYSLTKLSVEANDYVKDKANVKMLEWGLADPEYIDILVEAIKEAKSKTERKSGKTINPKRIWVAGGSGAIAKSLSKVFPDSILAVVSVGTTYSLNNMLQGVKHEMYKSNLSFPSKAMVEPPYKSLENYDAKIWEFALKNGENGDYIWNVK